MNGSSPLSRPWSFHTAALALALLCSAWVLFGGGPGHRLALDRVPFSPANDCLTHMEILAAAAEAQSSASASWFEAPRLSTPDVQQYPVFQFYCFLPYHLPALALRAGLSPYQALLAGILLSFVLGAWGMAGLLRAQGFGALTALLGAAAYTWAPFHVTDLFGRFAYPELFAFGLMPWVFWLTTELAERPSLGVWLAASAAWMALILSHNIFHIWAVPLIALWLLLRRFHGEGPLNWRAPLSAYAFGVALSLFFFAPVLLLGGKMAVTPMPLLEDLSPLWVVLNPLFAHNAFVAWSSPLLGLQVGWAFLLPALALLRHRGARTPRATLWLFSLTVLAAAVPIEHWYILGPWKVIQYPYRILLFSTLFGTLLLARWAEGRVTWKTLAWGLVVLSLWSVPWKRVVPDRSVASVEADYRDHGVNFRAGLIYGLKPAAFAQYPEHDWSKRRTTGMELRVFPRYWYPGLYKVSVDSHPLPYGYVGKQLAVEVPAKSGPVDIRYQGLVWAKVISGLSALLWACGLIFWSIKKRRA